MTKTEVRGESGAVDTALATSPVQKDDKSKSMITTIDKLIEKMKTRPPMPFYWSGIKKGSMGFVFGPAKSGKTIFCENLGMAIAAGAKSFIDRPLTEGDHKVLFISLEEHCQARIERNEKQLKQIIKKYGDKFTSNFMVVDEDFPRYIKSTEEWNLMNDQIQSVKPDIVFIDSLTRVYSGVIEESAVAKRVTERLSTLAKKNNITMIIIHHTPKDKDAAISIESLAGSRVLSQEADFMIGINKFSNGNRYMKEVACRYKRESEKVIPFEISEDLIIKHHDPVDEMKLLVGLDRRTDTTNRDLIHRYIQRASAVHGMADIRILQNKFVENGRMGKQTLFDNLKKLFNEGKIGQEKKGEYFAIIE